MVYTSQKKSRFEFERLHGIYKMYRIYVYTQPKTVDFISFGNYRSTLCDYIIRSYLQTNAIYLYSDYCPLVTEKSTNPSVKLTLSMPRHGKVNLTRGLVDFSVTNGQSMLIIFLLYVPKRYISGVNVGKLEKSSSRATLPFRCICL